MSLTKLRDFLIPILTICIIFIVSVALIAYGRGYRLDITQKSINPTGLIAATSDPTGAQVYVDGKLNTATNNTINVNPGWYKITIAKEGFQNWEKNLRVQGEVVTRADAYLFPSNPSLSTLTTFGVVKPALSPDGSALAYIVPKSKIATTSATSAIDRSGIWIHEVSDRPLGFSRDARQIATSVIVDFSDALITWSPDSKELVAAVSHPITQRYTFYLLDAATINNSPRQIINMGALYADWQALAQIRRNEQLASLKPAVSASVSAIMKVLSFSPDESKILYQASISATLPKLIKPELIGTNPTEENRDLDPKKVYVYDVKEDRNYEIGLYSELGLPENQAKLKSKSGDEEIDSWSEFFTQYIPPLPLQWLPTNRHLIVIEKDKIEAIEFDNTNRTTLYAGPFWDGFAVPWSNASRILILTNLNPAASSIPNLYAVNLR